MRKLIMMMVVVIALVAVAAVSVSANPYDKPAAPAIKPAVAPTPTPTPPTEGKPVAKPAPAAKITPTPAPTTEFLGQPGEVSFTDRHVKGYKVTKPAWMVSKDADKVRTIVKGMGYATEQDYKAEVGRMRDDLDRVAKVRTEMYKILGVNPGDPKTQDVTPYDDQALAKAERLAKRAMAYAWLLNPIVRWIVIILLAITLVRTILDVIRWFRNLPSTDAGSSGAV